MIFGDGRWTYPQIPVLLMAIDTSPSFKPSPFCMDSSEGSDSAIQRSCAGLVNTPMFDLVIVVVEVADMLTLSTLLGNWQQCDREVC